LKYNNNNNNNNNNNKRSPRRSKDRQIVHTHAQASA